MVLTALDEGLDSSAAERVFGYRQATITSLSDSRRRACSDFARARRQQSPAPTHPVGRTALQATQHHTGALALAGNRPPHEDSSRTPTGTPHAKRGASGYPLPATTLGPRLPADLHQRWPKRVLLCPHSPFLTLARDEPSSAQRTPVANGRSTDLLAG